MSDRAVPPADITPAEFFTSWVPRSVDSDPVRQSKLAESDHVLVFHLDDPEGEVGGAYTVRIDEGRVHGERTDVPAADLRIHLTLETWRALNAGELSATEAFVNKRVRLQGDLRLAVKLHLVLG